MRYGTRIPAGLSHSTVLASGDFEAYSEAGYCFDGVKVRGVAADGKGGLPVVGTPNYVAHPSAEVLSFYYDLKDGRGLRFWMPGAPNPLDLFDHIARGGLFAAWNVTFEWYVWNVICVRKYGWPPLPLTQCRCDMAKSRRYSLPGALGTAAGVLGTPGKDKAGNDLIQKLTRPHTPTKKRKSIRRTPATDWDLFVQLYSYNEQDVVAEDAASALTPDLTETELQQWLTDQTINARGVQVDIETLDAALDLLGQAERKYTIELATITGGAVGSVSEVAKFGDWLSLQGCPLPDMQKETIENALKRDDLPPVARRALEIRQVLGSANVKKLRTLKLQVSSDGRLRNQYMYCGADRTGRASAGGVQLQNMTGKGPRYGECEACGEYFGFHAAMGNSVACPRCNSFMWHEVSDDWGIKPMRAAIADVRTRSLEHIERTWGDPVTLLCGCLRGMFIAAPGKKLLCVDFSAIEAVVAACLSRCQWRIDVFNTPGECIYTQSASKITGTPLEEYKRYKAEHKSHHPDRKKIGKIAELASGYGGWIGAWVNFGADEYFTDPEIKEHILAWRAASPEIEHMWGGQYVWCGPGKWDYRPELYGLEGCAIQAIQNPGKCYSYIDITYAVYGDVLYCRLPSGRFLHYHRPRLTVTKDKLRRDFKRTYNADGSYQDVRCNTTWQITFEGYNSNSQKGPVGWQRMETYGGRLFENVVQAVAADIQFGGLTRLEDAGYPVVMHTHDEGCAEVPTFEAFDDWVDMTTPRGHPFGTVADMKAIMVERPHWAAWWPINAAGWEDDRYQKD